MRYFQIVLILSALATNPGTLHAVIIVFCMIKIALSELSQEIRYIIRNIARLFLL